jgi:hypothetical protein
MRVTRRPRSLRRATPGEEREDLDARDADERTGRRRDADAGGRALGQRAEADDDPESTRSSRGRVVGDCLASRSYHS